MQTLQKTLLAIIVSALPGLSQVVPDHVSGRILVQRTRNADKTSVERAYSEHGAKVVGSLPELNIDILSVPEETASATRRSLEAKGLFTFAEPDGVARGGGSPITPNDPDFPSQWHLSTIQGPAAWGLTVGSSSVPIAMIDSGVDSTHPDLTSKVIPGYNFLTLTTNTADDLGHGTATAGTAAAASNNATGITGVNWLSPIMPLVVLDSTDYASYSNIASAIDYAVAAGVRIINISIGGSTSSSTLQSAVNYAWSKGAVIFASAMNNSTSAPYYPAACEYVLAVSATEPTDTLAGFSNYGSWISLSAPGDNIFTTIEGGGYEYWYGTSFSSPIAAATAALALGINPSLTAQGLVTLLEENSDQVGGPGFSQYFGWGRINAYRVAVAAQASIVPDTTPPTVKIISPTAGTSVSGTVQVTGTATDNVGVVSVQLWIDGTLNSTCTSLTFSCSWNTAAEAAGTHTIKVEATDTAGNVGSASETVTVTAVAPPDTTPPTVKITSPTNGATVSGTVQIAVSATDNVGVTQVAIYIDNVLEVTDTVAPYTYSWNMKKASAGTHTITARAFDKAGNTASASVSVTYK